MEDLYSPRLSSRYSASLRIGQRESRKRWPVGCGGAGNAFLALIGPSMGGEPKSDSPRKPFPMNFGANAMNFDWGDHRKIRWTRLCSAILGSERRARALTALLNLSPKYSTDATSISLKALESGWTKRIEPLFVVVRPRIVCALTNAVWDTITSSLDEASAVRECPFDIAREPIAFRIPGCEFTTFLVKPHNHPSRFLRNEQIDELGRAYRWLISRRD